MSRALDIIQNVGPDLGLHVNLQKCELFGKDKSMFISTIPYSIPHFEILGAPVSDAEFCNKFIIKKHFAARAFLSSLEEIGSIDPHVAFTLLCLCAGFCKLSHLARVTPPSLAFNALQEFNSDIRLFFFKCTGVDTPDHAWHQAQLSLHRGGLGLHSLAHHSLAAYMASLSNSNSATSTHCHLASAIALYNTFVPPSDALSVNDFVGHTLSQRQLSDRLEDGQLNNLVDAASCADKAQLLSTSLLHASAWLTVVPSDSLGLHLQPHLFQSAIRRWLGISHTASPVCPLCPDKALDTLGHHCTTCKCGRDVTNRHNMLRNALFSTFRHASLSFHLEVGCGWGLDKSNTRLADILVSSWDGSASAAFDISVTSPLNSLLVVEAVMSSGVAARAAEKRKHLQNDAKCKQLGWRCIPLVVETYGAWGAEAIEVFSTVASRLAVRTNSTKPRALATLYGHLSMILVRANAGVILMRSYLPSL